jgi:hypothetical protein
VASALFFGALAIHVRNVIGAGIRQMIWPVAALIVVRGIVSVVLPRAPRPMGEGPREGVAPGLRRRSEPSA